VHPRLVAEVQEERAPQGPGGGGGSGGGAGGAGAGAAAPSAAPEPPPRWLEPSMAPALVAARHQVDSAAVPHMASPAFGRATAVVQEVVISRAGHFTCPVLCGAVLLGQAAATPGGAAAGAAEGQQEQEEEQQQPDGQQQQAGPAQQPGQQAQQQQQGGGAQPAQPQQGASIRRLVAMPLDPMCAALNECLTLPAVLAAAAAGRLPPPLAHHRLAGAEWVEFSPLPERERAARAAAGWPAAPVVWFRFVPRADLPPEQQAAGDAALQVRRGARRCVRRGRAEGPERPRPHTRARFTAQLLRPQLRASPTRPAPSSPTPGARAR
jgi:hypothetical protein